MMMMLAMMIDYGMAIRRTCPISQPLSLSLSRETCGLVNQLTWRRAANMRAAARAANIKAVNLPVEDELDDVLPVPTRPR